MPILDTFERRGLFGFTRILALSVIVVLILGLIAGAVLFGSTLTHVDDKRVEPNKVIAAIKPLAAQSSDEASGDSTSSNERGPSTTDSFPGLKVPFSLQPYFSRREFREFMVGKLSGMAVAAQQEYVDNMGEVVDAAKSAGLVETEAIKTYIRMKDTQIDVAVAQRAERTQMRIYVLEATGSAFGLIGLFSLILVLLAIERNTRVHDTEMVSH